MEPVLALTVGDMPATYEPRLVSVIVIFLNAEQFLQEALASVFAQTYGAWELLLVDDGSSDGSTRIAQDYAEKFPARVHYLEHPGHANRGMSASRNLGIRHSRGESIAFLDADDVWLPGKLEHQVGILEAHPDAAMVYGLDQWWYSWTGRPEDQQRDFTHQLGVPANTLIEPPALILLFFLTQRATIPNPSSILVRRGILRQVDGFVEAFRGVYEDQAFYAKVCLHAPVFAAGACWSRYRQHPESSVAVAGRAGQDESARLVFLRWLAAYLSEQGVAEPAIWKALRRQLRRYRHPKLARSVAAARDLMGVMAQRGLPLRVRQWLRAGQKGADSETPVGRVRFGSLRRVTPLSREFGYDRGRPVDRYYIEGFLSANRSDIHGHVLEIADDVYTRRYGGDRVVKSDVLHVREGQPHATIVADLACADQIPAGTFDCVILTQTLQFIFDVPAAVRTVRRILRPGGVVLATLPGISSRYDMMEPWGCFWGFTSLSARRLFEAAFPATAIKTAAHGNVLAAAAFLYGIAAEELDPSELDSIDPDYEVIITVRAVSPASGAGAPS
jgi:glycosyltransferase involved in cell wall biosynthesis/SAM-dependent methyltransferase